MTSRVAIVLLGPVRWAPPGLDLAGWRAALAEDVVDLLATLAEVEPAIAATANDGVMAEAIAWPGMRRYVLASATPRAALAAAVADGYDQAVVLAADAPDLPALVVGKLLRPLSTHAVAIAPAVGGRGLLGLAARLPAPDWLPDDDLDTLDRSGLRNAALRPAQVATSPGWHRIREPNDLARLDPGLEGWDATRALLS